MGGRKVGVNKRERVDAALHGEVVDRVPVAMWRHFHKRDQSPGELAQATLEFYRHYDLDLIKVTPSGLYGIEDWGAAIRHSNEDDVPPQLRRPVVDAPEAWRDLVALTVHEGALGRELEALSTIRSKLAHDQVPVFMTVFSPLTLAYKLAGAPVVEHLREHPDDLHFGLATIAETTVRFGVATLSAGADGIFFATQLARSDMVSEDEYRRFGERYDMIVLEHLAHLTSWIILHLHGQNVFFDLVHHYPVSAVSWHDRETQPSLREALTRTDKTLMAGIERNLLVTGSPQDVAEQVRDAHRQTEGGQLILAPSCVIPPEATEENLRAVVDTDRAETFPPKGA
jgi:uroporphyrinogen decarboxylase